ncbi:unnamed protein product [Closterium sp. NIES-54]
MTSTRVLLRQGQPLQQQLQHSRQWGPEGPRSTVPSSSSANSRHDVGPCGSRIPTGPGAGTTCSRPDHSVSRCYRCLDDLHRERFGPHAITPHWPLRLRQGTVAPIESHLPARVETCVSSLGACVLSNLGASEGLCVGAAATTSLVPAFVVGSGASSPTAQLSFTLKSGVSSCFFHDCTVLTPLQTPVTVALADHSVGPVAAQSTTTLPCPAAPSGVLTGYYTNSFSRNLVGVSHLHDLGVFTTFPLEESVASCTDGFTRAPLATFPREPRSGLYSLHTGSHHTGSGQVRSGQVRSGQVRSGQAAAAPCDCRSLTHQSGIGHHHLGHPSFPLLIRMVRHHLVSCLPKSLAPLPRSLAPPCTPCVEGRQRTAPHSSSFPPTMAPLKTLHFDVWGPSPVLGPCQERFFLIVVDDFSCYTMMFPLLQKASVPTVLEPWLLARGGAWTPSTLRPWWCVAHHSIVVSPAASSPFRFPPCSSLRSVTEKPGGVPAGGTGGTEGVIGGDSGYDCAGTRGAGTLEPTLRAQQERVEESHTQQHDRVEEESHPQQQVQLQQQQERVEEEPRPQNQEQQREQVQPQLTQEEAEQQHLDWLPDPSGPSRYHADCPFHVVLRPRVPPRSSIQLPPTSSLPVLPDPVSDSRRATRPIVPRVLSSLVTHPSVLLSFVSALATTVSAFALSLRLDYTAQLVGGPFPFYEVLDDRQLELEFLAAVVPHLYAMLPAPEGDPDALDIPVPRTHAEVISGPWASCWIALEEAEMASYWSTGTYVDAVPSPGTNVVSGKWLYKVKCPPGSPPVFKARCVEGGFSQREGVDFFQTFAPTPTMTTLPMLLHIAAQPDYELHSLDFSTAFLQGSLDEQIWLRRPPGFTGSFPPGTQWQMR